jgi:uncharacterized cupredoxin-like copper-binding protein
MVTVAPASPTASPVASATPQLITVDLSDALRIEPSEFSVAVGRTVTFVITNGGGIVHEFFVGDAVAQAAREAELVASGGDAPGDTMTGRAVAPGQTEELTYVFTETGAWIAGCHVTNHYAGGMTADITVAAP